MKKMRKQKEKESKTKRIRNKKTTTRNRKHQNATIKSIRKEINEAVIEVLRAKRQKIAK
jgi:hypothetical protein